MFFSFIFFFTLASFFPFSPFFSFLFFFSHFLLNIIIISLSCTILITCTTRHHVDHVIPHYTIPYRIASHHITSNSLTTILSSHLFSSLRLMRRSTEQQSMSARKMSEKMTGRLSLESARYCSEIL